MHDKNYSSDAHCTTPHIMSHANHTVNSPRPYFPSWRRGIWLPLPTKPTLQGSSEQGSQLSNAGPEFLCHNANTDAANAQVQRLK